MKKQDISLETFKKDKEALTLPPTPTTTFIKYNNLILLKNQWIKSDIGGILCLQLPLKNKSRKLGFSGKQ